MTASFCNVALAVPLRTVFTYGVPESLRELVQAGTRVLVPFRRPEFFYMQGKPAGVLMEAFREIESILNAKYKTTAANRIVVVLLPTPVVSLVLLWMS